MTPPLRFAGRRLLASAEPDDAGSSDGRLFADLARMTYSARRARLAGLALALGGLALLVIAVTGAGRDWLGGWLFRCGARGFRHVCADGEVPWGLVFMAGLAAVGGLLIACGEVAVRRGGVSFRAGLRLQGRAPDSPAGDNNRSFPPPKDRGDDGSGPSWPTP